jgi:hypothetical protein
MRVLLLARACSLTFLLFVVLRFIVSAQLFTGAEDLVALSATMLAASLSLIGHVCLHLLLS